MHGTVEKKNPSESRYPERVEHLREKCKNTPSDGLLEAWNMKKETYTDIVVDEQRRVLFCGVPKDATNTMKRAILKEMIYKLNLATKLCVFLLRRLTSKK